jgi:hypothetical protein
MKIQKVWGCFIVFSISQWALAQQSVQWDVASPQTIIAGSGCQKDVDAFASTNGNDLAVVFTRLGVDLPGGGTPALADRKNCSDYRPRRLYWTARAEAELRGYKDG